MGVRARYVDIMTLHEIPIAAGLALLKIEGELDFTGAPAVRSALAKTADDSAVARMVIDLGDVTAADDRGVASLAAAVRKAIARHPSLRVIAVAPDASLAGALTAAKIPVYGHRADAARFIDPEQAA